jgi:hypothetical protein
MLHNNACVKQSELENEAQCSPYNENSPPEHGKQEEKKLQRKRIKKPVTKEKKKRTRPWEKKAAKKTHTQLLPAMTATVPSVLFSDDDHCFSQFPESNSTI